MKKIITLLFVVVLLGAGCNTVPSPTESNPGIESAVEIKEPQDITTDKSKWVLITSWDEANFSQDTSFLRPPELTVKGGDSDYGRITELQFNSQPVFTIVENTIFSECPTATCENLGELVSVSPEKYFSSYVQRLKESGITVEDKKVGNLSGKMFVSSKNQTTAIVLSEGANYTIIDEREAENGDSLFNDFITSFQFNGKFGQSIDI